MKFKLDENFGTRTQQLFRVAGHEVQTVAEQNLQGSPDQELYGACGREQRCLVTLDLGFANVLRFPPAQVGGIVVIRLPRNPSLLLLGNLVREFLRAAAKVPLDKKLWVVETGRIRVHQTDADESR